MTKKSSKKPTKKIEKAETKSKTKTQPVDAKKAVTIRRRIFRRRKNKGPKKPLIKLSSVWVHSKQSVLRLWNHKGLFIWMTIIYGLFDLVLAEVWATTNNVAKLKLDISQVFAGHASGIGSSFSTFFTLSYNPTQASNGTNTPAGLYQSILVVIFSLALIWAMRHITRGEKMRIRDSFYRGMTPLIPFLIVLIIIGLQLLPIVIGSTLYLQAVNNGIAVGSIQKIIWELVFALFSFASLYMISSSILAIFVVTLPGMTPVKAVKKASELARGQRLVIFGKLLFLLAAVFVLGICIMVPVVEWLTPLTQIVYFLLTIFAIPFVLSYGYTIYNELSEGDE